MVLQACLILLFFHICLLCRAYKNLQYVELGIHPGQFLTQGIQLIEIKTLKRLRELAFYLMLLHGMGLGAYTFLDGLD